MEESTLNKISGRQTIEFIAKKLSINLQSAINLVSRLRKKGYVLTQGGGKQPRIYTIATKIIKKKGIGVFDIINKYSKIKVYPLFEHKVIGKYHIEDAIIDAIKINDNRVLVAMLPLFNHVKKWTYIHEKAKKYKVSNKLCMLYEAARLVVKVRKMPKNMKNSLLSGKKDKKCVNIEQLNRKWKTNYKFNLVDLRRLK